MTPQPAPPEAPRLRRVLTFFPLVLYGLGVIVGAGIYVALGAVMERAGSAAPWSFLVAGLAAALTGLCYAELGSRFPEAAGAVAYVRRAFGQKWLTDLVGVAMTAAVAISAASIAHGAVIYLEAFLPLPKLVLAAALIVGFTVVAAIGIRTSVGLAAVIGAVEIVGLAAATALGWWTAPDPAAGLAAMVPAGGAAWLGVASGAFIAFFAFIGFETISNLAEEAKDPHRTIPLGILGSVALSIVLYVSVAAATILSGTSAGGAGATPLLDVFAAQGTAAGAVFGAVGFLAVANGVLVEIVMLSRLFYGMASRGDLPAPLAAVNPRTQTPIAATIAAGAIVLVASVSISFEGLLVLANAVTLMIFTLVDVSLWWIKRRHPAPAGVFAVPAWVPPLAAVSAAALVAAELLP